MTPWEGAVRIPAAIWSPLLTHRQRVSKQLFHISDLLPTFANLADIKISTSIDGMNIWDALSLNLESPRTDVLCNIDKDIPYVSYINNQWKYINGTTNNGKNDGWLDNIDKTETHQSFEKYGQSILNSITGQILAAHSTAEPISSLEIERLRLQAKIVCQGHEIGVDATVCDPLVQPCLFNIIEDPCEENNIALYNLNVLRMMEDKVKEFSETVVLPRNKPSDPRCNPKFFNDTWTWWYDELGLDDNGNSATKTNSFQWQVIFYFVIFFKILHSTI